MRALGLLLVLLLVSFAGRVALAQESCTTCHGAIGQLEASRVHARAGVSCVTCHGGVPGALTVAEAHAGGVWVPADGLAVVDHCGGCHSDPEHMRGFGLPTDQLLDFWTSSHGARLRQEPGARVASCVSCHGSHGILSVQDPRAPTHPRNQPQTCGQCHADAGLMADFELSVECIAQFRDSVHGKALLDHGLLSSPSCADCHGAHGALPPRVSEVGRVCGRCHVPAAEAFRAGPHWEPARAGAMQECASCHGSHEVRTPSLAMLLGDQPGHCGACHEAGSPALAVGRTVYDILDRFDQALARTEAALSLAATRGVFVDEQMAWLAEARALRSRASPLVHSLDPVALGDLLGPGEGMIERAHRSLDEARRGLRDRRIFVSVFALLVLVMAAALLLHAREVARRATGGISVRSDARGGGGAGA